LTEITDFSMRDGITSLGC